MNRRFGISILSILVVLLIICLSAESQAWWFWGKEKNESKAKLPLYESPDGWQIWKAYFGSDLANKYAHYISLGGEKKPPAEMEYVYFHGDDFFLGFTLRIPEQVITYWGPKSEIVVTYTTGKEDSLQLSSTYIFFTNPSRTELIFTYELESEFYVSKRTVSVTASGNPVVFAHFPFPEVPKRILSCTVENVRSNIREVNQR